MLTKQTGASQVVTVTGTTATVTVSNTDGSAVRKVRVATTDVYGVLISTTTTTNLNTAGILIPGNSAEHFSMEGSNKVTLVRSTNKDVLVSVTPIA